MPPIAKFQTFDVQGLKYTCPETPARDTIRNAHLPVKDQVWERDTEYEKYNWNLDPKEGKLWYEDASKEQQECFDKIIERLYFGEWIMIKGVAVYFNKYCWFFFQFFVLQEGKYPIYKEVCLEYFRFYEICENDPFTLGDCGIKGRRLGLSSMSASIKVLIGLIEDNTLQGIVSKTGTDAFEMFLFCKNGIENLPEWLMPDLNKVTDSEIHIAKPAKKISKNNTKATSDKGKNNRINWLDTSEKAYDGRAMRHVTLDEAGKWKRANVQICLSKISDTLVIGSDVNGHVSIFTTVDKGDEGGDNFRIIWNNSDHIGGKLDKYGRTASRLKRFFIPAYRGYGGYVGKYGESIIENPTKEQTEFLKTYVNPITKKKCPDPTIGAKQWLEETRKSLSHDSELLAEEKRKNPFEWKEVFEGANNKCYFDLEQLNDQIELLETRLEGTGRVENGRRIKFKNADSWVDDPNGDWYVLKFPDEKDKNKHVFRNNIRCPDNTILGAAGLDGYANARSTVDKGSNACVIIHERYNALDPYNSDKPIAMFYGRPSTKLEFHEQIYWGLQYFGIKMLGERSPTDWIDYATQKSLASDEEAIRKYGYLVVSKRADGSDVYGVSQQAGQHREQHLTEMKEYANNNINKIEFLAILKNMIDFDINNRTDFDACMAWGYSLMAIKETTNAKVKPKNSKLQIIRVFRKSA